MPNITIQTICDSMTDPSMSPLDAFAAVSNSINAPTGECVDMSYDGMIAFLSEVGLDSPAADGSRQWTWQTWRTMCSTPSLPRRT